MDYKKLKNKLDSIYLKYHKPEYLCIDPLVCLKNVKGAKRLETTAFLASCLAYGRVERIIHAVMSILDTAQGDLYLFIKNTSYKQKKRLFTSFKHRFNDGADVSCLLESIKIILTKYGTIENMLGTFVSGNEENLKQAMSCFSKEIHRIGRDVAGNTNKSFEYMVPSPVNGSACKRFNMYLRWMIRENDGIDFGLWKRISPSILIIPVDTHISAAAAEMGLTKRRSSDWKTAEQITGELKKICPADPVRYDFSLCRYGMDRFRKN